MQPAAAKAVKKWLGSVNEKGILDGPNEVLYDYTVMGKP